MHPTCYRCRIHGLAVALAIFPILGPLTPTMGQPPGLPVDVDRSSATAEKSSATAENWYTQRTQWNGFDQFHFRSGGRDAYLVVPLAALDGKPWIWRARFPGYHAEMDIELVRHGYHLAYLDVAEQFGCPSIVEKANEFYRYLVQQHGLNPKPVLEGVSRGGLFVYNWAAENPGHVACIYCDTPVCDIRSWPGGHGSGIGSKAAWKKCLEAYGLTADQAEHFDQQPVDKAAILAAAKIPIMHVVSANDHVVPPAENTNRIRQELIKAGHDMTVILVAEGTEKSDGHHFDHPDPQRVIQFIRRHAEPSSLENAR